MSITNGVILLSCLVGTGFATNKVSVFFHQDYAYKGETGFLSAIGLETAEDPCNACYNFKGHENELKYQHPKSIALNDDYFIRLYENEACKGDAVTFCDTGCECDSGHLDLEGGNQRCFVTNTFGRNYCPGDVWATVVLSHKMCNYRDGILSFSVHRKPERKDENFLFTKNNNILSRNYPTGFFGVWVGSSCPFPR